MVTTPKKPAATRKTPAASKAPSKTTAARKPAARGAPTARAKDGTFKGKSGNHWGTAAIVGGVAAVGAAATAALFALRGTSWSEFEDMLLEKTGRAHQADGTDSSKSFDAEIPDEGTIPA